MHTDRWRSRCSLAQKTGRCAEARTANIVHGCSQRRPPLAGHDVSAAALLPSVDTIDCETANSRSPPPSAVLGRLAVAPARCIELRHPTLQQTTPAMVIHQMESTRHLPGCTQNKSSSYGPPCRQANGSVGADSIPQTHPGAGRSRGGTSPDGNDVKSCHDAQQTGAVPDPHHVEAAHRVCRPAAADGAPQTHPGASNTGSGAFPDAKHIESCQKAQRLST